MAFFRVYTTDQIQPFIHTRKGETKLGEALQLLTPNSWEEDLKKATQPFVTIGVPEDLGVRANSGVGGAATAWSAFLKSFLNIQHNSFFSADNILLLGAFDFSDWMNETKNASAEELSNYVHKIDELVYPVIEKIAAAGKIPIVIGGGHNNCYPIIKGCSLAFHKKINTVNLDAHADYRIMEGRHSGNGFRYAAEDNYLHKYAMIALHEAYNNQAIIDEIQIKNNLYAIWWEDIFIRKKTAWEEALQQALQFVQEGIYGVELDVDCIQNVLSSAATPIGITALQAIEYLYQSAQSKNVCYLHIAEAVSHRNDGEKNFLTGKLISYLVQGFIKGYLATSF